MFWLLSTRTPIIEPRKCSSCLEVLDELGSRQDRLGLLECLNFLVPGSLANLKILHDKIAILVELSIVVGELLQLEEGCLLIGDSLLQILLCLGLLLSLVDLGLGLLLNGGIGVLDKFFIRCLGFSLSTSSICLHFLGIIDDLLNHAHDTSSSTTLLVLLESRWRRWALLLLLHKGSLLLLIESLEDVQGCRQKFLRSTLISNNLLKFLVLLLAIFTSTLQLSVELGDLRLQGVNLSSQGLDGQIQIFNQSKEILLFTFLALSLELIGVEFLNKKSLCLISSFFSAKS